MKFMLRYQSIPPALPSHPFLARSLTHYLSRPRPATFGAGCCSKKKYIKPSSSVSHYMIHKGTASQLIKCRSSQGREEKSSHDKGTLDFFGTILPPQFTIPHRSLPNHCYQQAHGLSVAVPSINPSAHV